MRISILDRLAEMFQYAVCDDYKVGCAKDCDHPYACDTSSGYVPPEVFERQERRENVT